MGAALPPLHAEKTAASPTPAVVLVRGSQAMAELVPAWEELAAGALEPNPFHEPWFLLPAIELLGAGEDVRLLTVWLSGKLGALLPVCESKAPKGLFRRFAVWRHKHSMLGTPLVRGGTQGAESLRALLRWLASGGAPALELGHIACGGPFHAALTDALNAEGLTGVTLSAYSRALLRRAADADTYIAGAVSSGTRRTLERKEAQLRSRGALEYRSLGAQDDAQAWIEDFLALEASGWKKEAGSAMACSAANRRFAAAVAAQAHPRGRLMMSGLDFDGRPIARLWCFVAGAGSYGFKSAYDESFKSHMPGFLAELHNIREFHARAELQWMDSYTSAGNSMMDRLWRDRLVMQTLLVAGRGLGGAWAAATPLARWAKQRLKP